MIEEKRKRIFWITGVLGSLVFLGAFLYAFTPAGKMIVKGITTGLIFHPEAYTGALFTSGNGDLRMDKIELPAGFRIEVYAEGTETMYSSPNTVPGTERSLSATGSPWLLWNKTRMFHMKSSPKAGVTKGRHGVGRWTSWSCRTGRCWYRTTRRGLFTGFPTVKKERTRPALSTTTSTPLFRIHSFPEKDSPTSFQTADKFVNAGSLPG